MKTFARRLVLFALGLLACSAPWSLLAAPAAHIVFVVGDHEYGSEHTMPALAKELSGRYGFKTTVLKSVPDKAGNDIPGMEALQKADLAIVYLRWRLLPEDQVKHLDAYTKSGKPLIGFRTTSHPFNYPAKHPLHSWNAWGAEALGTPPGWNGDGHKHYGHDSTTAVTIHPGAAKNPLLKGVAPSFQVRSWLYHVLPKWPPVDSTTLLMGKAINPNRPAIDNPVAWTWKNKYGGRAFYTSLGHPDDFKVEAFQRLVLNSVYWALGQPIPEKWKGPMDINVTYGAK